MIVDFSHSLNVQKLRRQWYLKVMIKDEDTYPLETVVRLKKTGEFALLKKKAWLRPDQQKYYLHYEAIIEGRGNDKFFAIYHDDVEPEAPASVFA